MSTAVKILIGLVVGLILISICVVGAYLLLRPSPEPEPTATEVAATAPPKTEPVPTSPPGTKPVGDDSWDEVKAAGKIVVGTSADYPPFEFYVGDYAIDGFDVALMDEIGRRLGVEVQYRDFAFDGLSNALQLKQIDTAIAALSVTPERESIVDFSNVYFVGEDGILAQEGDSITIGAAEEMAGYRVGVQRSTVYEDWLRADLVDTGLMPAGNLFAYEKAEDAVRDLREDRVDLVVLDASPAEAFVLEGGVELAGRGFNQQRYALALPKGALALRDEINRTLTDMHNEGFITQLAKKYLDLDPGEILPTPTPGPTSTPALPPACVDGMTFIEHPGQGEGEVPEMQPGQPFTKVWRVKNSGTCTWDSSYRVVYNSGNVPAAQMGGKPTLIEGEVAPGQVYDIKVNLVAPLKAGTYRAFWQMENGDRRAFGDRLQVRIRVPAAPTATPAPTQTPVAGITFAVDRTQIKGGECVTFYWKVDNVKEVYFYKEGQKWQDHGVTGEESRVECPPTTITYYLRVVLRDDSVEVRQITIYVEAVPDVPNITRFTVDPPNQITLGQCVTIRWRVEGAVSQVAIAANDNVLWEYAPTSGSYQHCPDASGTIGYSIQAAGPGGTSRQHQNINVVDPATATPVPTAAPDKPVIYAFGVNPIQIAAGQCVNISWSAGGGTTRVTILRGQDIVWDNAPLTSSVQDCPTTVGSVTYGVLAYNVVGETVSQQQAVTIAE